VIAQHDGALRSNTRRARTPVSGAFARATWIAVVSALTLLASVVPFAQGARGPAGSESFDQLYARGQALTASIKTLTARFTETTTSALLTRPLVARGTLAVERPSKVVLRYTEPSARVVLIDNKKMTTTWPTRQTLDIGAAQGRVQRYFVNGTAAELRQQFDIDDKALDDTPGTFHVTMVPKRKQIREALTKLDLWVSRETSLLHSMRMTFANGDTKHMAFEQVMPNPALAPGIFSLEP
jgi:outer membrane lipoprotein-sorting protein